MVESHGGILHSNENEWPLTTHGNMSESDKHAGEQKRQETQRCLQEAFMDVQFKSRQSSLEVQA